MHFLHLFSSFMRFVEKFQRRKNMPKFNLGGIFKKEPSSRSETRGSGSNAPMRSSYNEDLEPLGVIVLARETDVRSSVYPCYEFLQAAGGDEG